MMERHYDRMINPPLLELSRFLSEANDIYRDMVWKCAPGHVMRYAPVYNIEALA